MQVKPLADRVVIKPMEEMEVKKGGIIITDTANMNEPIVQCR